MTTADHTRQAARHQAYCVATAVCAQVGRQGLHVGEAHYVLLYDSCCEHLSARFAGRFREDEVAEIVLAALVSFLVPLYVRHPPEELRQPEDLFELLDDVALGRLGGGNLRADTAQRIGRASDRDVVACIFGDDVHPADYRSALGALRGAGEYAEFLAVTEYVDQHARTGMPPSYREVADGLGRPGIDAERAEWLILRFTDRLPRRRAP
jgi:hypothetical protein